MVYVVGGLFKKRADVAGGLLKKELGICIRQWKSRFISDTGARGHSAHQHSSCAHI